MPRRARLLIPGMPLHIVQRGHNRQACFYSESDYLVYLERLREHASSTGCSLHAYVLMTNHVHLLASFDDIAYAPDLIRLLGQQYSLYLNRRLGRTGTIWEGRYWSCPIPTERYFLTCQQYIELNPVEAEMVGHQRHYRWSSYPGNAGLADDTLISPHELYLRMGASDAERQINYCRSFEDGTLSARIAELEEVMANGGKTGEAKRPRGRPRKS